MKVTTIDELLGILREKKQFYHESFGVTRMGVFGSFTLGTQTSTSDIDMVIEMEKDKKNLHNFLQFKRALENEFQRSVDLGFEHTLKPIVKEKLQGKIKYV